MPLLNLIPLLHLLHLMHLMHANLLSDEPNVRSQPCIKIAES